MNINALLKKEGITEIEQLDAASIKAISQDIAIKLCLAFPEHEFDRQSLYNSFCNLDMYFANMPKDSSGAKYISGTNSIYFNKSLTLDNVPDVAMHECIHYLQESRLCDKKGFVGLTSLSYGLALNEAGIQLMASEANMSNLVEEKYFDILIKTISPDYYPLECALLYQVSKFVGTYPLYHSILNSDDIFKNTFITKFNKRIYNRFARQLDKLLHLESDLNELSYELSISENVKDIQELNSLIDSQKIKIKKLFFNIQNFILRNCFLYELDSVSTMDDLTEFKNKLYNYKDIIGTSDGYTFYNDFYTDLMNASEIKKQQIEKYGEISLFKQECTALTIVDKSIEKFNFAKTFIRKLKKLFKLNRGTINDYDN